MGRHPQVTWRRERNQRVVQQAMEASEGNESEMEVCCPSPRRPAFSRVPSLPSPTDGTHRGRWSRASRTSWATRAGVETRARVETRAGVATRAAMAAASGRRGRPIGYYQVSLPIEDNDIDEGGDLWNSWVDSVVFGPEG